MAQRLRDLDWDTTLDPEDINAAWTNFLGQMKNLMEEYIPKRRINANNHKRHEFPLSTKIRSQIKEKNKMARKVFKKQDVTSSERREYNKRRNRVQKLVKKARKDFERSIADKSKTNPKAVWSYINSKAKTKADSDELHFSPVNTSSATTKNEAIMAQLLSDYFESVYTIEDTTTIPTVDRRAVDSEDIQVRTNPEEVRKLLEELKVDKSPGPDGLHPNLLKKLATVLAQPLARLFNLSFEKKMVPDEWKSAKICAIHKKGNLLLASSYQPVSLTPV